jgi:hypothetical protein
MMMRYGQVLTVEKFIDFKKLISGDHIPPHVGVRKFNFKPQHNDVVSVSAAPGAQAVSGGSSSSLSSIARGLEELNSLEMEFSSGHSNSVQIAAEVNNSVQDSVSKVAAVTAASALQIPSDIIVPENQ